MWHATTKHRLLRALTSLIRTEPPFRMTQIAIPAPQSCHYIPGCYSSNTLGQGALQLHFCCLATRAFVAPCTLVPPRGTIKMPPSFAMGRPFLSVYPARGAPGSVPSCWPAAWGCGLFVKAWSTGRTILNLSGAFFGRNLSSHAPALPPSRGAACRPFLLVWSCTLLYGSLQGWRENQVRARDSAPIMLLCPDQK